MLSLCRLLALLLPVLICTGCSEEEPAVRVDLSRRQEITLTQTAKSITYAYLPQYSHSISYERHWRLVQRLAESPVLPI